MPSTLVVHCHLMRLVVHKLMDFQRGLKTLGGNCGHKGSFHTLGSFERDEEVKGFREVYMFWIRKQNKI